MNKYELASLVSREGLNNGKLTASKQRELFGFVIAGQKDIRFDSRDQGTVTIGKAVNGHDYVSRDYSYEEFARCVSNQQKVEAW